MENEATNSKKWVADPPMKDATDYLNVTKWGYNLVHDAFLISGNSVIEEAGQYGQKHGVAVNDALTIEFILERVANIIAYMKLPVALAAYFYRMLGTFKNAVCKENI